MIEAPVSVETILAGYETVAADQVRRAGAIDPERLLSPAAAFLPERPARILDVGAGAGRNAGWLAARGHDVLAVEPVWPLREAGRVKYGDAVRWLDDRLPHLAATQALDQRFDLILLSAVWQHMDEANRSVAMPALAGLLADAGRLVISLRHGPGAANRPVFACAPEEAITLGLRTSLTLLHRAEAPSVQAENAANGVTWTWLVFAGS